MNDNYMNSITGDVRKMSDWNRIELREGEELVKVVRNYATDITTVEEFVRKYYKPNRFLDNFKGSGYEECLLASYKKDCNEYGEVFITRHDSITGEDIYFKGS